MNDLLQAYASFVFKSDDKIVKTHTIQSKVKRNKLKNVDSEEFMNEFIEYVYTINKNIEILREKRLDLTINVGVRDDADGKTIAHKSLIYMLGTKDETIDAFEVFDLVDDLFEIAKFVEYKPTLNVT